ncbi:MAG: phasin family protein [Pseudomonadota bacterium]
MAHDSEAGSARTTRGTKARLQEAWQSTLGRFATAEEGSHNLVQRLVDWGKLTGDEGRSLLTEWRQSIESNRRQLERRVEEAMQRSMGRFTIPTQHDLEALTAQIRELERRVSALAERRGLDT